MAMCFFFYKQVYTNQDVFRSTEDFIKEIAIMCYLNLLILYNVIMYNTGSFIRKHKKFLYTAHVPAQSIITLFL